ncbi:hypothetical protein [Ensifer aridi]|uniref:hypothetical protein n=1 Tax=Ensifer aridi TaxID=1708715 RepID=UPI00111BE482|nr:hypothetical protein [Ensifer aridi]
MAQGRVQVRDLQSDNRLRPTPVQSDTYAAPARVQGDQNLARLSDALGSFSNSLGNLVPVAARQSKGTEDDAYQVQRKYAGWTPAQWNEAVVNGTVPKGAVNTEQMAISAMSGDGMAAHQVAELRKELMTTADWDATDVEQRVRQTMAETLEQYGADKNFGKPYARRMESFLGTIANMKQSREIEKYGQTKKDSAFGHLSLLASDTKGKLGAQERANRVLAEAKNLGKDGVLVMENADVDQELLNLAARSAEDDPEFALALIDSQRTGSKGEKLPSLASKRNSIDRTEAIRSVAVKAIDEKAFQAGVQEHTQAGLEALVAGNYDAFDGDKIIQLPSGATKKYEGTTLKDNVLRAYEAQSDAIAKRDRETGNDRIAREERSFTMSGLKNPKVETALSNLAGSADPSVLQDEEAQAKLLGKLEVYQTIRKNSASRLIAYTKEADREFAEAFFIARNDMKLDDKGALDYAISVNSVLDKSTLPSVVYHQDEISSAVGTIMNQSYGFDPDAANYASVHAKITKLAQHNVARGMEPKKAINAAAKTIASSAMMHNGVVLGNVNGAGPKDFGKMAEKAITTFLEGPAKKRFGAGEFSRSDLILRPISGADGTRFTIVDKETFDPIRGDEGGYFVVSLDSLRKYELEVEKREAEAAAAEKRKTVRKGIDEGHRKRAAENKRETDIREGRQKGFLEREGIELPPLQ